MEQTGFATTAESGEEQLSPPSEEGGRPSVEAAQFQPLRAQGQPSMPNGLELLIDVSLMATVELGRCKMRIRDILQLGPGSIIELDRLAGEPVDLFVNDRLVAKGEVVVVDENFGFRVTHVVSREERIAQPSERSV